MNKRHHNPVALYTGLGSLKILPEILGPRKALLVTTEGMKARGVVSRLRTLCGEHLTHTWEGVRSNPTIGLINDGYKQIKNVHCDLVIGLGGGSALDVAKSFACLLGSFAKNDIEYFLKNQDDKAFRLSALPVIAIPTLSGSGSQVTPWATIWDDRAGVKYSLSARNLFPEAAIHDAELSASAPFEAALSSALDSLSHAMESIWNKNANPVADILAAKSIGLSFPILGNHFREKFSETENREKLMLAGLLAGLAFSNTKTALAHSISYPLTAKLKMPHGIAVSFTLPEVMRYNYPDNAERVRIIFGALGASSLDEAVEKMYSAYKSAGVSEYVKKFLPNTSVAENLDCQFIAKDRAENNLVLAKERDAKKLLAAALEYLLQKK